jgi:hypothetical protein
MNTDDNPREGIPMKFFAFVISFLLLASAHHETSIARRQEYRSFYDILRERLERFSDFGLREIDGSEPSLLFDENTKRFNIEGKPRGARERSIITSEDKTRVPFGVTLLFIGVDYRGSGEPMEYVPTGGDMIDPLRLLLDRLIRTRRIIPNTNQASYIFFFGAGLKSVPLDAEKKMFKPAVDEKRHRLYVLSSSAQLVNDFLGVHKKDFSSSDPLDSLQVPHEQVMTKPAQMRDLEGREKKSKVEDRSGSKGSRTDRESAVKIELEIAVVSPFPPFDNTETTMEQDLSTSLRVLVEDSPKEVESFAPDHMEKKRLRFRVRMDPSLAPTISLERSRLFMLKSQKCLLRNEKDPTEKTLRIVVEPNGERIAYDLGLTLEDKAVKVKGNTLTEMFESARMDMLTQLYLYRVPKFGHNDTVRWDLKLSKDSISLPAYLIGGGSSKLTLRLKDNPFADLEKEVVVKEIGKTLEIPLVLKLAPVTFLIYEDNGKGYEGALRVTARRDGHSVVIGGVGNEDAIGLFAGGVYSIEGISEDEDYAFGPLQIDPQKKSRQEIKLHLAITRFEFRLVREGEFSTAKLPDSIRSSSNRRAFTAKLDIRKQGQTEFASFGIPKKSRVKPEKIEFPQEYAKAWDVERRGKEELVVRRRTKARTFNLKLSSDESSPPTSVNLKFRDEVKMLGANGKFSKSVEWPEVPQKEFDTISIAIEKPRGYDYEPVARWEEGWAKETIRWDGKEEIVKRLVRLPNLDVIYADITLQNIDRKLLVERIQRIVASCRDRQQVNDCLIWVTNCLTRYSGFINNVETVLDNIFTLDALAPSFYNELGLLWSKVQSYEHIERVRPMLHMFISRSTYKWIDKDQETLKRTLAGYGLDPATIVFYVEDKNLKDMKLGGCIVKDISFGSN